MFNSESQDWKELVTLPESLSKYQFDQAIHIWNNNPRSVNQRVHSSVILLNRKLESNVKEDKLFSIIRAFQSDVSDFTSEQFCSLIQQVGLTFSSNEDSNTEIIIKKLLPKSNKHFSISFELVIIGNVIFFPIFDEAGLPFSI